MFTGISIRSPIVEHSMSGKIGLRVNCELVSNLYREVLNAQSKPLLTQPLINLPNNKFMLFFWKVLNSCSM